MTNEYIHRWKDLGIPMQLIGRLPEVIVSTRLQAVAPGIIRVTHTKRKEFLNQASAVVVPQGEGCELTVTEDEKTVTATTGMLTMSIDKWSGALSFMDQDGRVLLREPRTRPHQLVEKPVYVNIYDDEAKVSERMSIDGVRADAAPARTEEVRRAYECRQNFVFDEDEGLYGLGSHEEGVGNLRGTMRDLYQHNMKAVVPMLVSTKGWGILFDMGCYMTFHDDAQGSYLWADCADELDWYFIYGGGSYDAVMEGYRQLTGESPMLPLYSLGYIQSKERYKDADELIAIADEYRRREVPLDMVVLDWQSWPNNQWGYKTFDPSRFPDPDRMMEQLHERNVKLMISIWPSMQGDENENRKEMLAKGLMLGNRTIYDAFKPEAREVYWRQANEGLFSHGVDAWWCDCSEPFESDWGGEIKPEPGERARINTAEAKKYIDPGKLSLYSLYHSQGIYKGQREVTDDKRVINLTRSSYAGQHRYATITWSGDVGSTWEVLRRHVPEGLNFMATGEGFWSADIGGFFPGGGRGPWFAAGDFNGGVNDLGYRELFVRWMQYGACLPCMRAHGTSTPREVWRFGEKGEPFYDALAKTIQLRYRLTPYLYGLMAEQTRRGVPMVRVPALVFPQDKALRQVDNEMMLGGAILARPVTHPMMYGPGSEPIENPQTCVEVTLPAGHDWYALESAGKLAGGQKLMVEAPLDVLPLYVRAGTILPWGAKVQHTAELAEKPLDIVVYPGEDADYELYMDAGDGYGYEQGEYAVVPMHWDDAAGKLTIGERKGGYPGMKAQQQLVVRRVGGEGTEVRYEGQAVTVQL